VTGVGVAVRDTFAVGAVRTERASFGRTVASTEDRLLVRDRSTYAVGATFAGIDGAGFGVFTWTAGELAALRTGDVLFRCDTRLSGVRLGLSRSRPASETASAAATESWRERTPPATRPVELDRAGSTTGAATGGATATDTGGRESARLLRASTALRPSGDRSLRTPSTRIVRSGLRSDCAATRATADRVRSETRLGNSGRYTTRSEPSRSIRSPRRPGAGSPAASRTLTRRTGWLDAVSTRRGSAPPSKTTVLSSPLIFTLVRP
jgi:hypothetical protein